MGSEPYLFERFAGCYKSPCLPPLRVPAHMDPNKPECTTNKYKQAFKDRWNLIRQDPLSKFRFSALNDACCEVAKSVKACDNVCINPGRWANGQSLYSQHFCWPKSHNDVDDCCGPPCICGDELPDYCRDSKNSCYVPQEPWCPPCPPMSDCTTYKHAYCPQEVNPRCPPPPQPYVPCDCPMEPMDTTILPHTPTAQSGFSGTISLSPSWSEIPGNGPTSHTQGKYHPLNHKGDSDGQLVFLFCACSLAHDEDGECTTTRSDFTRKCPVPNGPSNAEVIKHGLWSASQFCKEFTDVTTNEVEYPPKCAKRPPAVYPCHNLWMPDYPLKCDTETGCQYYCKSEDAEPVHCFHPWLDNENWHKPETPLEKCTTYSHFYKPHSFPPHVVKCSPIGSPNAIPFCSMNRLSYSCTDPKPNQKTPVEMKDNDPWPYVKPCQIRYQDNLQTDPCADFKDDTTYKNDYDAKTLCRNKENFAPFNAYVPPHIPILDDTTMKVSYPPYSSCQYQEAKTCSGNPCGIFWGPNKCPESTNKCLPTFPAPFGHPLKPFNCQCGKCPCGCFDDRSTYNHAFKFRSGREIREEEENICREMNVPKGVSLYRFDFVWPHGNKAARMPPPTSKGHRCMHPYPNVRQLDSLHRLSYRDFWKTTDRSTIDDVYRAKPFIKTRRSQECVKSKDDGCCNDLQDTDEEPVLYQPVIIKVPCPKKTVRCPCPCAKSPENVCRPGLVDEPPRRCRPIPYSGKNIRNLAKNSLICDGYEGQ